MFLKELRIEALGKTIRAIQFKRGLNLIVDATPLHEAGESDDNSTRTGNNVGKTTALRCVDYCLGGKDEALYLDAEFNQPNAAVSGFLTQHEPKFILELEDSKGLTTTLSRQFGDNGGHVNGHYFHTRDYSRQLQWLLFRVEGQKPTLREMTPKFVRVEAPAKTHILKWIFHGTDAQFETAWLTLFRFRQPGLLKHRADLQKRAARIAKQRSALSQLSHSPRQERPLVEKQLQAKVEQLRDLSLEGAYEGSIETLSEIRRGVRDSSQRIAEVEAQLGQVRRTMSAVEFGADQNSSDALKELFSDAGRYIEELHADYQKLVAFHDALTANKTRLIGRSEERLSAQLTQARGNLARYLRDESGLLQKFADPDTFADVRHLSDEIARLSQRKGELESLGLKLREVEDEIASTASELMETEVRIKQEQDNINATLETFNGFFSDYTKRLYNEMYYVRFAMDPKRGGGTKVTFGIKNMEGHEGSGKKRGVIAAFDLAYLRFMQEVDARTARFTLNDEVELIDTNQLRALFLIAQSIDGQFILPVLRDRLAGIQFDQKDECVVLELSQEDRFFRIP